MNSENNVYTGMQPLVLCKSGVASIKQEITDLVLRSQKIGVPMTRKSAKKLINERNSGLFYANDVYSVQLYRGKVADQYLHPEVADDWAGKVEYISIRRNDREPCDSWRDFQEIKNQLCGPDREAVQIYPAEWRLVDTANQYHLWVLPLESPFPMGFWTGRAVAGNEIHEGSKARQSNR